MGDARGRRQFVGMLTGAVAGAALLSAKRARAKAANGGGGYRAVVFDGFTLFDPRPIAALASQLFPEKGAELMNLWRVKQFDYQWLSALFGHYRDFWACAEGALTFAARSLKIELNPDARDRLMHSWLQLKPWPDVAPALRISARIGPGPSSRIPARTNSGSTSSGSSVKSSSSCPPRVGTPPARSGSATPPSGSTAPEHPPKSWASRPTETAREWRNWSPS